MKDLWFLFTADFQVAFRITAGALELSKKLSAFHPSWTLML
jgi:hypothetical protein